MSGELPGIFLIRHGEGTHNTGGFYSANPQHPAYRAAHLTPTGRIQARQLAENLLAEGVTGDKVCAIVCSPLPRTRETASIVMERLAIPEERFRVGFPDTVF